MMKFGMNKTYEKLNKMIEDATAGTFEEGCYDESQMSKLEVKWKRFISSSKLSKDKIEEERKNIKTLISDVSHQTKTPLSNIMLYSQILQEQELDKESCDIVKQIIDQSEKLEFLIESLVKTSRLETGTLQLHPKLQFLLPMIQSILIEGQTKAKKKGITIQLENVSEEMEAVFDRKWTEEAIYNILDNAIKYSPENTAIVISMMEYEMFARISIRDEGIGITQEELPLIFGRFYRGRNVTDEEGVGIGLYLARSIISEQKGYMKASSVVGKGSSFDIYLPKSV
ncbi:MAG: HAMP domain-containing sensor histidine kinase [Mobilitalea sp.]